MPTKISNNVIWSKNDQNMPPRPKTNTPSINNHQIVITCRPRTDLSKKFRFRGLKFCVRVENRRGKFTTNIGDAESGKNSLAFGSQSKSRWVPGIKVKRKVPRPRFDIDYPYFAGTSRSSPIISSSVCIGKSSSVPFHPIRVKSSANER